MLAFIDWILHGIELLTRNGVTLTTIVGLLIFGIRKILMDQKVLRRLRKRLPWLVSGSNSEVKDYVNNQQIIIHNIKRLMERVGLEWDVPTLKQSRNSAIEDKGSYMHSTVAQSVALDAALPAILSYTNSNMRRKKRMNKFKSRKFWMAVVSGLLIVLNDGLDIGLDSETVIAFAGIMATFILGESAVDAKKVRKEQPDDFETPIEPRL
jgi:hypothetical protein